MGLPEKTAGGGGCWPSVERTGGGGLLPLEERTGGGGTAFW